MSDETTRKVDDMKNRAAVKIHGIENSSTFEHPASFSATTK